MLFLLAGIYVLSEVFKQSRQLSQSEVGLIELGQYLALRVPGILHEMAPFGVLLGVLLLLGELARHGELIALRAGGLSLIRLACPLLLGGLIVAALSFVTHDRVAIRLDYLSEQLLEVETGESEAGRSGQWLPSGGAWFRDGAFMISVDQIRNTGRDLRGATLYRLGADGLITAIIRAKTLVFRKGQWLVRKGYQVKLESLKREVFRERALPLKARPEVMADLGRSPERMTFLRLWRYAEELRHQGQPVGYLEFMLWQKLTLPLACVVMALVAAPFVTLSPRAGGRVGRILAGIGLGLAFHASNALVENLSVAGSIPPGIAAWAPLIGFGGIGGYLLYRVR